LNTEAACLTRVVVRRVLVLTVTIVLLLTATGCAPAAGNDQSDGGIRDFSPVSLAEDEKLRAVATTSLVFDVVANVGGNHIELTRLIPLGTDPHIFEPTPREVAAIADAHVVFANGAGLELFLEPLLVSAASRQKVVEVSLGIELLALDQEHAEDGADEHNEHDSLDPHTWTDPNNVVHWVENIERALSALDPAHQSDYQANARAYRSELEALDGWVRQQVGRIPAADRQIVADHLVFGYLAQRYGFRQVGAVVPGFSTLAQPSARELAELQNAIRQLNVRAVLVGRTVNPVVAEAVARDTGVKLVTVYTGSLSDPSGEAATYLEYIRYNVGAIVGALE